jgi:hypothetical protein
MTYDQSNETLRFVGQMNRFAFAVLAGPASQTKRTVARWAIELAGLGGPSCTKALEVGATRWPRLSIASGWAVGSDQRLRCGSGAFPSTSSGPSFRGRPAALQNEVWGAPGREKSCAEARLSH